MWIDSPRTSQLWMGVSGKLNLWDSSELTSTPAVLSACLKSATVSMGIVVGGASRLHPLSITTAIAMAVIDLCIGSTLDRLIGFQFESPL
jgi:hypothetical protein